MSPGVKTYVPEPVLAAADATATALATSIAVGPLSVIAGGAERETHGVPCAHATVGRAITNDPAGSVSPLEGHASTPASQWRSVACSVRCQPSRVVVESMTVNASNVV